MTVITSPPATLYELTKEVQQLDEKLTELLQTVEGDELPLEIGEQIDSLLQLRDGTEQAIADKYDNYCALIQSRQRWAEVRRAEAERMAKLANADFRLVGYLKSRLKANLEVRGCHKIRTQRFQISIAQNGGKLPVQLKVSPRELPKQFQRVTVEADSEALRQALEKGEAGQFAAFAERGTHLRIK